MRLINARANPLEMKEFANSNIPPYAILSHTWDEDHEVTFEDMRDLSTAKMKKGFEKIEMAARLALEDNLQWVWVDTCCIDKSSSSELSEAINSMFLWYQRSNICYVYLADLSPSERQETALARCRWLTRGWTLQELVAPRKIDFFDRGWHFIGNKYESTMRSMRTGFPDLKDSLRRTTGIDGDILEHSKELTSVAVAKKMSWASKRTTSRIEDTAYCLLGLFGVNMPLLYGEEHKAFIRLQHQIIQGTHDMSIFAWKTAILTQPQQSSEIEIQDFETYRGILAESPSEFAHCQELVQAGVSEDMEFSMTNRGLRADLCMPIHHIKFRSLSGSISDGWVYLLPLYCYYRGQESSRLGVYLRKVGGGIFVRACPTLVPIYDIDEAGQRYDEAIIESITILSRPPQSLEQIRQSRAGGVVFHLPEGWTMDAVFPLSHFDCQDRVMLRPGGSVDGWCLLRLMLLPRRQSIYLACFVWTMSHGIEQYGIFHEPEKGLSPLYYVKNESHVSGHWVRLYVLESGVKLRKSLTLDIEDGQKLEIRVRQVRDDNHGSRICSGLLFHVILESRLV
jgi:hypothetical protein